MVVSTRARAQQNRSNAQNARGLLVRQFDNYCEADCMLSPDELRRLAAHQYSAIDISWLDEFCMKTFWDFMTSFYPTWLAPNCITLIGLLVNLVTVFTLTYFCPSATETAPSWAYFLAATGLFVYQTLDATDGKQARRIGCASPLGELFDHGCDSMTQVFITLNICYAMQLGTIRSGVFLVCLISIIMFYCAHWSTYCTEAQMVVIGILVVTGLCGPQIWSMGVLGLQLRHLILLGGLAGSLWQVAGYLNLVLAGGAGRNGSTVAGTSVVFPVCPLLAVCVPFSMLYSKSNSAVFDNNVALFALFFGAVAAKSTNRLIVAHMSKSELILWDWIYLGPIAVILNQYYDYVSSSFKRSPVQVLDEYRVLWWATIYAYVSLLTYCIVITRQFCEHLNIYCFYVTPRRP